jgi:siroheme synthase
MELIRVQEIINALLTEAKIEIAIPPGVAVATVGVGNLGAPVVSQGATTNIAVGSGVIR